MKNSMAKMANTTSGRTMTIKNGKAYSRSTPFSFKMKNVANAMSTITMPLKAIKARMAFLPVDVG